MTGGHHDQSVVGIGKELSGHSKRVIFGTHGTLTAEKARKDTGPGSDVPGS